ncbi:WXG100 family type VII secretion target [Mesobacillus zeae]|uniref:ESAT-6-like protein n=1 Tax=Mesobacillus zeae TaxID=1917180 RepID=A0A398AYY7_9BACI|nr:WXG100 family type VII secretion target [Mesobacillus zeae]RID81908.1 WXG100 family type VII secretion target [Mesobacillus zeae]
MSGVIRVTPQELVDMSQRYGAEASQVGDQVVRLDKMIDQLKGMWEGASSQAFDEQYTNLRPSFIKMQELLEDVRQQLDSTAKALQDADAQIASQIRG